MGSDSEYALFGVCGHQVTKSLGQVSTADTLGEVWPGEDGGFEFDYDGQGSEVFWDTSEALKRNGHEIFMCDQGDESPRHKIELRQMDEETGEYVAVTKELGLV